MKWSGKCRVRRLKVCGQRKYGRNGRGSCREGRIE
jgi:hypothetical protein